jgi:hypothetical protein
LLGFPEGQRLLRDYVFMRRVIRRVRATLYIYSDYKYITNSQIHK